MYVQSSFYLGEFFNTYINFGIIFTLHIWPNQLMSYHLTFDSPSLPWSHNIFFPLCPLDTNRAFELHRPPFLSSFSDMYILWYTKHEWGVSYIPLFYM